MKQLPLLAWPLSVHQRQIEMLGKAAIALCKFIVILNIIRILEIRTIKLALTCNINHI